MYRDSFYFQKLSTELCKKPVDSVNNFVISHEFVVIIVDIPVDLWTILIFKLFY